jgi:hypothetical protein
MAAEISQSLCNALTLRAPLLQKNKSQRVTIQFTVVAPETKRQLTKAAEILKTAKTAEMAEMAEDRSPFTFLF